MKELHPCKHFSNLQNRTVTATELLPENRNKKWGESITGRADNQILFSDPDTHSHELCMQSSFITHTS